MVGCAGKSGWYSDYHYGAAFCGRFPDWHIAARGAVSVWRCGRVGSFLMGLAFAFGWTPCIGPILAPILGLAGSRETVGEGAFLLALYSAGLGIPFLLAAFFVGTFMGFLNQFRSYLGWVEFAAGIMLIATGILFLTGGLQVIASWMLEAFPILGKIG